MPPKREPIKRFWEKVDIDANGCWLWKGSISPEGYGRLSINNYPVYAHRWSYEHFVGPIPEGLVLDHLCRVRNCVNPYHLEIVTTRENCLRGESIAAQMAHKTHCANGHPWNGNNTHYRPDGSRYCRACGRERERRRKERMRNDADRGAQ
ncbi:MAG: HNH endonuclease [Chloroflexi bacterium]|nr:MAG: HNH endonuclease [Chloroflexota bacterium]